MDRSALQNNRLVISFSGIDGAGKSTQIARLRDELQHTGLRVEIITFWDDVVALKRFREGVGHKVLKGDKGVGSPNAPIQRRDKNVQSPLLTVSRMALYLLDAFALRRAVKSIDRNQSGAGADVIIFDRYLYDELVNLSMGTWLTRLYVRAMLRLAPKPDVAFVLDAEPSAAFARKPEYPLDFLHENRRAYLAFAETAGMSVIPALSIEQAHAEIHRLTLENNNAPSLSIEVAGRGADRNQFSS